MKLSLPHKQSPLWLEIEAELRARLAQLRERNDSPMGETETAKLRGQIAEIRLMLGWAKDVTVEDVPPDPMRA